MPVTGFGDACVTPGCGRPRRPAEDICSLCFELSRLTGRRPAGEPDKRPSLEELLEELARPGGTALERGLAELASPASPERAAETLLGVAAYAARALRKTDGQWPPAARATACREALSHIEAECRRVHQAVTQENP